jgi:hypothetical protein
MTDAPKRWTLAPLVVTLAVLVIASCSGRSEVATTITPQPTATSVLVDVGEATVVERDDGVASRGGRAGAADDSPWPLVGFVAVVMLGGVLFAGYVIARRRD